MIRYENIRLGRVYILKAIQFHSVSRDFLYSVEIGLDNARLKLMNILQTEQMLLGLLDVLPWKQDWQQRDELRFVEQRSYHIMNLVVSVRSDRLKIECFIHNSPSFSFSLDYISATPQSQAA